MRFSYLDKFELYDEEEEKSALRFQRILIRYFVYLWLQNECGQQNFGCSELTNKRCLVPFQIHPRSESSTIEIRRRLQVLNILNSIIISLEMVFSDPLMFSSCLRTSYKQPKNMKMWGSQEIQPIHTSARLSEIYILQASRKNGWTGKEPHRSNREKCYSKVRHFLFST